MTQPGTLATLWRFLSTRKKYWLTPIVTVLALFAILLALGQTSAGVFVYTLF